MNGGDTHQGNQVPPHVKVAAYDQVRMNPPAITDGEVRATLFRMDQAITTQDESITTQANREVAP